MGATWHSGNSAQVKLLTAGRLVAAASCRHCSLQCSRGSPAGGLCCGQLISSCLAECRSANPALTAEVLCCLQLISARLQYFLQGVFITLPTASSQALNITVRLYDTASNLVNTSAGIQVQVGMLGTAGCESTTVSVGAALAPETKQSACSSASFRHVCDSCCVNSRRKPYPGPARALCAHGF